MCVWVFVSVRLLHALLPLPNHTHPLSSCMQTCCCGLRPSFFVYLLAIVAFSCVWGYLFSLSERAKVGGLRLDCAALI